MSETAARVFRECGDFPLLSGGDINLYSLFVERRAASLIHARGVVGILTPSGIAADLGAAAFFRSLTESRLQGHSQTLLHSFPHPNPLPKGEETLPLLPLGEGWDEGAAVALDADEAQTPGAQLIALFDFENKKVFFPDIHASFKFCALVFGGEQRRVAQTRCAFYLHSVAGLDEPDKVLTLSAQDFTAVNPNTGAAPIFRSPRDAVITLAIYRRQPVLVNRSSGAPKKLWPLRYVTMFHMTNDAALFKRRDELEGEGWYPVTTNRWKKGEAEAVPLFEGKMVQIYDHRAADVVMNPDNLHRPAQQVALSSAEHENPQRLPHPQFWIDSELVAAELTQPWAIAFKDVTAPTNVRTMIAAIVPFAGYGNTLPVLVQLNENTVIPAQAGIQKAAPNTRPPLESLLATATTKDDRRHRLARLDALFFHLYGLNRDDAAYILEQFPIVREHDERDFGCYLTRDLILAYMNAIKAGDFETRIQIM